MSERAVAISLKIPDNAAFTASVALGRLGVEADRIERSEIWHFDDTGEGSTLVSRIEGNETIFNPNKHRLTLLEEIKPRPGEVWIEELGRHDETREHLGGKTIAGVTNARRYVAWRFLRASGEPEGRDVVQRAAQRLLCNPAIERALF
ncbi:MAG: hypothetical protein ABI282_04650 [Candidatus Baltobacteraceae bacterium]